MGMTEEEAKKGQKCRDCGELMISQYSAEGDFEGCECRACGKRVD